ncbi:hypothetical protein GGE07_005703 [Sinorhizobium terangae]|uniref:Uncharacterized protein n=1 Tax=Sinorhizobium terangae TaxID=110322 RepID=A0A6N7LN15_SINTE|nr:hypothetical protein [Sinorhizobium terangae]MBB4189024.1 hypothetical protein [Sinorhizobium terangae]MQX19263.1 hypothetical protein [Sinorhizobium terangae]
MHAAKEIFAYQVIPGTDEVLAFAETLATARREASEHCEGLKAMGESVEGGIAIYRVRLKDPSLSDLVTVLNYPEDTRERLVQAIERLAVVS